MPALHAMRPTAAAAPAVCEHARRQAGGADAPRGRASQRRRTQQQAHGALAEQAGAEQLHAVAPRARDKILQDRRARAAHSALGGRCGAALAPAAAPAALGALHACTPGAGLQAFVSQGRSARARLNRNFETVHAYVFEGKGRRTCIAALHAMTISLVDMQLAAACGALSATLSAQAGGPLAKARALRPAATGCCQQASSTDSRRSAVDLRSKGDPG